MKIKMITMRYFIIENEGSKILVDSLGSNRNIFLAGFRLINLNVKGAKLSVNMQDDVFDKKPLKSGIIVSLSGILSLVLLSMEDMLPIVYFNNMQIALLTILLFLVVVVIATSIYKRKKIRQSFDLDMTIELKHSLSIFKKISTFGFPVIGVIFIAVSLVLLVQFLLIDGIDSNTFIFQPLLFLLGFLFCQFVNLENFEIRINN